jgi:hypothetical protein
MLMSYRLRLRRMPQTDDQCVYYHSTMFGVLKKDGKGELKIQ